MTFNNLSYGAVQTCYCHHLHKSLPYEDESCGTTWSGTLSININYFQLWHIWNLMGMMRIPADQNSPKWRSTGNIWNLAYWISDRCCIQTYLIHIYHMSNCSKSNWNRYIEGFSMWNVHFHINGLSPNIAYVILISWPLMTIYFPLLNYWLFSVQKVECGPICYK